MAFAVSGTVTTLDVTAGATVTAGQVLARGVELTEISSGLTAGDTVVLADLSETITSDDEESTSLTDLGGTTEEEGAGGFGGGGPPDGGGPSAG